MALRKKLCAEVSLLGSINTMYWRSYSSNVDMKKTMLTILKRIEIQTNDHPSRPMVAEAMEVLQARALLIQGVSILLKHSPIVTCKFCPEVYIGEKGHLIRSCSSYKRRAKDQAHEWVSGGLEDILVPVETFHMQNMSQGRIPAVVKLCWLAGADLNDMSLKSRGLASDGISGKVNDIESLSPDDLIFIANGTLRAWETVRSGVQKLLLTYPAKVCQYCSEALIGPSGRKAHHCGVFKFESSHRCHFWKKANVDDLVPQKIVWRQRRQDPEVLVDEGREYYGHAPAVVELCSKAGAVVSGKYFCMMKIKGLSGPDSPQGP